MADSGCGLSDGSAPGDWRLPNVRELHSLADYGQYGPALPAGHPFIGFSPPFDHWSSTTAAFDPMSALVVWFETGEIYANPKFASYYVLPVRDGQ